MVVDEAESRVSSSGVHCHNHNQQFRNSQHVNGKELERFDRDDVVEHQQQQQQLHQHRQEHLQCREEKEQLHNQQQESASDLEVFRRSRRNSSNNHEMVAQDMNQSYDPLFNASQEPQEFIALEELGSHVDQLHQTEEQSVSTSNTSAHLYPANHNQQTSGTQQHRTYYNLSSVIQDAYCPAIYFGSMGESSGTEELLPPASTPAQSSNDVSATVANAPNNSRSTLTSNNNSNNNVGATENGKSQSSAQGTETASHMERNSELVTEHEVVSGFHCHHQHPSIHLSEVESASTPVTAPEYPNDTSPVSRKRKVSGLGEYNGLINEISEDVTSARPDAESKKQNHSEIEKRRRDKMNTYITELSALIPMCHAMSRKLDKLTVLRMAVQHIKTILGTVTSYTEGHYKPTFLSDQELKTLILQTAEGFVFVVGCDRGRILYVSESVSQTLNYSQEELLGQSCFDIVHPKDVAKVKEQLSSSDLSPRERLIDAKTMLPVKTDVPQGVSRLCPGARRSFFCRMKRKVDGPGSESQVEEEAHTTTGCQRRKKQQNADGKYCVIHCTGYLKSWAPAKIGTDEQKGDADGDGEGCNLSCLVAVGRLQPILPALTSGPAIPKLRNFEFVSRHALDGKFLYVDQRATLVLGFLPQELQGTSMYEYYHHDDIPHLSESHKTALQTPEGVTTRIYRFRTKGLGFVKLQTKWKSFRNPWTKDIDYLIAKNSAIYCDVGQVESSVNRSEDSSPQENCDYFSESTSGLERLITSHVEMSKIGRRIAGEVMDNQRRVEDCSDSSPNGTLEQTSALNTEVSRSLAKFIGLHDDSREQENWSLERFPVHNRGPPTGLHALDQFQITTTVLPERVAELPQAGVSNDNNRSNQTSTYSLIRNNVQLNSVANDQGAQSDEDMMEIMGGTSLNESPNALPSDGNDEAAMAVIMSLLEADAGLGGPVDFSGLPWPLP